jgi:hypothetical protein
MVIMFVVIECFSLFLQQNPHDSLLKYNQDHVLAMVVEWVTKGT